jgi:hypothetical protein
MIKVLYIQVWKCHNETFYLVQLIFTNKNQWVKKTLKSVKVFSWQKRKKKKKKKAHASSYAGNLKKISLGTGLLHSWWCDDSCDGVVLEYTAGPWMSSQECLCKRDIWHAEEKSTWSQKRRCWPARWRNSHKPRSPGSCHQWSQGPHPQPDLSPRKLKLNSSFQNPETKPMSFWQMVPAATGS